MGDEQFNGGQRKPVTVGDRVGIRDFVRVVDEVKAEIPNLFPRAMELKAKLTALQVRAQRTSAVTGHEDLWEEGAHWLSEILGNLDSRWKKKAYAIWAKRK